MSKLLSVSIPDDLMAAFEHQARERGVTKSELARAAIRITVERDRWTGVFGHGERLAARAGVGPDDVEGLVDEVRDRMGRESRH